LVFVVTIFSPFSFRICLLRLVFAATTVRTGWSFVTSATG
jgi:hypothetical protein